MSDRIHVATRKGLFELNRSGGGAARWSIARTSFLGDNVSMVLSDPRASTLYAALDHGHFGVKVHRSIDGGGTWEECAAPTYPEKPADLDEKDMWGRPLPWSTVRIWALEPGAVSQPGTLWCGTLPGGLFRSDDGGTSWQIVRSLWEHPDRPKWMGGGADLPGIHSIRVDPRDANRVRIGVSTGGMWMTEDGGASWTNPGTGMRAEYVPPEMTFHPIAQDIHALAQCRTDPDRLWVQHHNGIFRSDDGGASWSEIKEAGPSTFGFPVVVHPENADTAWFVPAIKDEKRYPAGGALVVTRTRDAGRSFEVLSRGLPQTHAYDLVYRHGLALDDSGTRLAMGSTTGGLWVSEDQGDSWQTVSLNLPPIHAVRFA